MKAVLQGPLQIPSSHRTRRRPILEYAGHVEFVVDFVAHMCEASREDELAAVNGVDPDEHVDESKFNDIDAAEMARRIRSAGNRAEAALDGLEPGALDCMLAFNGNPAPCAS